MKTLKLLTLSAGALLLAGCSTFNALMPVSNYQYQGSVDESATVGSLNVVTNKFFAYTRKGAELAIVGNAQCHNPKEIPVDGKSYRIPGDVKVTLLAYGDVTYGGSQQEYCPATAIVFTPKAGDHYWTKVTLDEHALTCKYAVYRSPSLVSSADMKLEKVKYSYRTYSHQEANNSGYCIN